MKVLEVIPSKRWVNKLTGATASLYGAAPYQDDNRDGVWAIQTTGWTWRNDNGTIGLGRVPAKTYEEAMEVMIRINSRGNK